MSEPKKHHYVPEVYLKRFALNKTGDLYILAIDSKYNRRAKKRNVSQICYEINRYTFDDEAIIKKLSIDDPKIIEKKCFKYENNELTRLFDKIDYSQPFTKSEFEELIRIVIDLKQRNPSFSNRIEEMHMNADWTSDVIHRLFRNLGFNEDKNDEYRITIINNVQKKFNNPQYKLNIYRKGIYEDEPAKEEVIQKLLIWKPFVFSTKDECSYITSDNPGHTINDRDAIYNTNFDNIQAFVFPISPKSVLFLMQSNEKCSDVFKRFYYRNVDSITLQKINEATARLANEIIIGNSKEQLEVINNSISEKK